MTGELGLSDAARAGDHSPDAPTHEVTPDLAYRRLAIVNAVFYGRRDAGDREWVLIDTGVAGTTGLITAAAEERFGAECAPRLHHPDAWAFRPCRRPARARRALAGAGLCP